MGGPDLISTRRAFLAGVSGSLVTLAGCGVRGNISSPVSLLVAGSLNNAMENGFREAVDSPVQVEAMGSARAARLVADGAKDPDIVSLSDAALFRSVLDPDYYAEFATNALVLVYDPSSAAGRLLDEVGRERWYELLLDDDVTVGRTDPDLDPLGYRSLFLLELATSYYDTSRDLRELVTARSKIYPEMQLLSQFETGGLDAAIAYRNMAVEREYDYVDLPAEIDLSDRTHADRYRQTSYELPDGTRVTGDIISYASAIRTDRSVSDSVFQTHVTGEYLAAYGLTVPETYPRWEGDVPTSRRD